MKSLVACLAIVLTGAMSPALAADVDVRINLPGAYQPPPPPVYVQPAAVYVQPRPVYVQSAPQPYYDGGYEKCNKNKCKQKKSKKYKHHKHGDHD